jgi:phage terminase large subunit-like protein
MTPLELAAQLYDPETKKPFVLLPAERCFLEHAFERTPDGRLRYPEQVYGAPKKSGKTTFAALHTLITTLLYGGAYPEATILANDFDQAVGRVFEMCRRIIECSPKLRRDARISGDRIVFPDLRATITALASDYASAAGGKQCIAIFDELWAYTSERQSSLMG